MRIDVAPPQVAKPHSFQSSVYLRGKIKPQKLYTEFKIGNVTNAS